MELKKDIYYVGVQDRNNNAGIRESYNSYLIKGTEKNVLIETVKEDLIEEYLENISKYIDIKEIDYLVINHAEPKFSGGIYKILELNPNMVICGTKMAIDFVRNIVNIDFKSEVLTANDSIELGEKELKFFAFPMLPWPDSMYTYLKEDKMLFSGDTFSTYSMDSMFCDDFDLLKVEYKKYLDDILGPFKTPFLVNALSKISLIHIDTICPGHGALINKNIDEIIEQYKNWCLIKEKNSKITICYTSTSGYTKKIAKALIKGINSLNIEVVEYDLSIDDIEKAKKDVISSAGILLGTPTVLSEADPKIYELISGLNPLINKGTNALVFGSYAWSGEATINIIERLKTLKFNVSEPLKIKLNPSDHDLEMIEEIGRQFAKKIINE